MCDQIEENMPQTTILRLTTLVRNGQGSLTPYHYDLLLLTQTMVVLNKYYAVAVILITASEQGRDIRDGSRLISDMHKSKSLKSLAFDTAMYVIPQYPYGEQKGSVRVEVSREREKDISSITCFSSGAKCDRVIAIRLQSSR
ncbi:hypothetical protein J6590_080289 [Homalodisca vitripennis]|nr:hypothetical protein J6590_080289 [Homalodisca vitripennis]